MKKFVVCFLFVTASINVIAADIFDAARTGNLEQVRSYVVGGGDLSVTTGRGYTPFMLAAYYGHNHILSFLQKNGSDVCAIDDKGNNVFMGVSFKGHVHTAEWLLNNTQCNINHTNYAGQTALMMASLFGREKIITMQLNAGADRHIVDLQGNTAESLAQSQGLTRIVKLVKFSF